MQHSAMSHIPGLAFEHRSRRTGTLAAMLVALCLGGAQADAQTIRVDAPPAYRDNALRPDVRAADRVSRMTLEEKIPQLMHDAPAISRLGVREYNWWNEGLHGVAQIALVGFQRIHLARGETRTVQFVLKDRDLRTVDPDGVRRIVPAHAEVWIGGGQPKSPSTGRRASGVAARFHITSGALVAK